MSKSYKNYIDMYLDEKALRKVIMSIKTDSTELADPKNTETDTTFKLFSMLATASETDSLSKLYWGGNFGYGTAKQMLFEKILEKFAEPRQKYADLMARPEELDKILAVRSRKGIRYCKTGFVKELNHWLVLIKSISIPG